ncbi:MAG: hypothetical protein IIC55_10060 [Proteobacteria bacterium]|nr:hypothetical protein [Pseudomonadota bacterium]
MMKYADENHKKLSKEAERWLINPQGDGTRAEWRYYMKDGSVVQCFRGVINNIFAYDCTNYDFPKFN